MCMLHWDEPVIMDLKKIRQLINKYGLSCPIRKRIAKKLQTNNVAENILNRNFTEHGARKIPLTDITYIPYKGIFCYLSTILNAYTKQILSYVLSNSLEVDFVPKTVNRLVKEHGIEPGTEMLTGMSLYKHKFYSVSERLQSDAVDVKKSKLLGQCIARKLLRTYEK